MYVKLSKHGQARVNQRGFKHSDIDVIRRCGTPINDAEAEVYLFRNKDIDVEISNHKKQIQRLERLRGCKAVFVGDTLVTVCRASRRHQKVMLRRTL